MSANPLNKMYMQNNVNAQRVIDSMVYSFGENSVQTCDGGIVKLTVNGFANDIKFVTDCLVYADIQIRRSGKGIIVLFIPKQDENPRTIELEDAINKTWHAAENDLWAETKPLNKYVGTIRHYFEMCLSDGERQNAFDNTPKYKWDSPAKDAYEALDIAFDFATSPQGYDYWNEIIERLRAVPETIKTK